MSFNFPKISNVLCQLLFQDFDAWFNTNSLVEEKQLVERLHSVSTTESWIKGLNISENVEIALAKGVHVGYYSLKQPIC